MTYKASEATPFNPFHPAQNSDWISKPYRSNYFALHRANDLRAREFDAPAETPINGAVMIEPGTFIFGNTLKVFPVSLITPAAIASPALNPSLAPSVSNFKAAVLVISMDTGSAEWIVGPETPSASPSIPSAALSGVKLPIALVVLDSNTISNPITASQISDIRPFLGSNMSINDKNLLTSGADASDAGVPLHRHDDLYTPASTVSSSLAAINASIAALGTVASGSFTVQITSSTASSIFTNNQFGVVFANPPQSVQLTNLGSPTSPLFLARIINITTSSFDIRMDVIGGVNFSIGSNYSFAFEARLS